MIDEQEQRAVRQAAHDQVRRTLEQAAETGGQDEACEALARLVATAQAQGEVYRRRAAAADLRAKAYAQAAWYLRQGLALPGVNDHSPGGVTSTNDE
jgi:hypothetical protein